ncbi:hypothetical protein B0I35DRAFT_42542 [Stachybotrys elegans]|uniref:Histidine kinase group protein n=1 Tax=Stachybotrys elegans TaxID=80388 RepID=A0A8K0T4T4_9HYPO|nr:hypothetical protein B0I35DRAFT_42542 [Stachybotrys elegans]
MAKKKSKQPSSDEGDETAPASLPSPPSSVASKGNKASKNGDATAASSSLIICRNKHWRYISCFHGPWLQMPIEILETVANINYNTPRPRPIDPAVFFDLVKVRRLVDEASNLAVRAASDIASPTLTNVNGGMPGDASMNAFGLGGPGHGAKLSRERKFRMREQASQKLGRAYRLDEIACSVATMQGASPLEDVGSLVLQRNPKDPDAKYVHFFHEKIPSRQLAESTSLQPLADIIAERPNEPEVYRTRATVKSFKADYDGCIVDLTTALALCRYHKPAHSQSEDTSLQTQEPRNRREVRLAEKDQPSSLESQLYFQRATTYLTMASQLVADGLPLKAEDGGLEKPSAAPAADKQADARKLVKTYARRALKDYLSFLSQFEYSPNLPNKVVREFNIRVSLAAHGTRNRHLPDPTASNSHTVYSLADLFAAVPPSDIPPYPSYGVSKRDVAQSKPIPFTEWTTEWITYHPLMTDALHSLILCHCLAQTSVKEVQRHAYMVARLVRLTDGYPVFQASRSPARSDWIEVMRRVSDIIQLDATWDQLCAPTPLPIYDHRPQPKATADLGRAATAAAALINGESPGETEEQKKERMRQQAILDALNDERVVDEATFRASVQAREKRAHEDDAKLQEAANSSSAPTPTLFPSTASAAPRDTIAQPGVRRWSAEDGREYPILTERAAAIAQWIREAPAVPSLAKRKRRPKKATAAGDDPNVQAAGDAMGQLDLKEVPAES